MLPAERSIFSVSVYARFQTCFYPDKISLDQVIALSIHSKIRGVSRANTVIEEWGNNWPATNRSFGDMYLCFL